MIRYQPDAYEYRDSGVEWLGEVPTHWDVACLKHLVRPKSGAIKTGPFGSQLTSADMNGTAYKVYNQRSVIDGNFRAGDEYISANKFHLLASFETIPGDLLITTRGTIGRAAVLPEWAERGILHPCLLRIQVDPHKLVIEFLRRLIQESEFIRTQLSYLSNATTIDVIYSNTIANVVIPVPPLDEQEEIIKFLDYETAKIDALIAKQQQLIALLQEKRQAVISHAVTKGLNPDAPLRDSGVEWLGKVPAHWEVSRLGYLAVVGNGSTPNRSIPGYWAENDAEGVGWLNSTKINDGKILAAEQFISQRAVRECHLPLCEPDSVLVAITGEGQTRGRAALLKISATINQHLAYLLPDRHRVDSSFLWRQLQARYSWLRFESAGGGSTRAALTCEFLRGVPITLPPLVEQNEIVKWLDTELTRLDSIVDMAQLSMDLLQERRTALISAAVTGKIDVRGWQPPLAHPAGALP